MNKGHVSVLFAVILASALVGCTVRVPPSYGFNYPNVHKEEWTQTYPADRDQTSTKCLLRNGRTGAQMRFIEDAFHSPTSRDAALAYRLVLKRRGFEAGDVQRMDDGKASFVIENAEQGTKGKVVVTPVLSGGRAVVIIAVWPVENDVHASADTDAVIRDLDVSVTPQ